MTKNRLIQIVCFLLAPVLLAPAAFTVAPLDEEAEWAQAYGGEEASLPPHVIVPMVALGPLRGLAIQFLWYRADARQQEGSYFEADKISDWITTLQPRYEMVWVFRAWNMAYNISVSTHTPEERWDWVSKGIDLLRDKGLRYNPKSVELHRELGWILYHKVVESSDDMNWYYKQQFVHRWQELLGSVAEGATREQTIAAFRRIVEAPDTLEQVIEKEPTVVPLLQTLNELGYEPNIELMQAIGRVLMVYSSVDARILGDVQVQRTDEGLVFTVDPNVFRSEEEFRFASLIQDPANRAAFRALVPYLRKRALVDTYNMDPDYMLQMMQEYGPMDWRHPAAHAAYWSARGTEAVVDETGDGITELNTYRGVKHAMQALAWRGTVYYDPFTRRVDFAPDTRFYRAYEKAQWEGEEFRQLQDDPIKMTSTAWGVGYENFLISATIHCYLYGDIEEAQYFYEKAKSTFHEAMVQRRDNNDRRWHYEATLPDFVRLESKYYLGNFPHARQYIDAMIKRGFREGLARNRPQVFARFLDLARASHEEWMENRKPDPDAPPEERLAMRPFEEVVAAGFAEWMRSPTTDLLTRARVWYIAPDPLRVAIYDQVAEPVHMQAAQRGLDPERVLPVPPGYQRPAPLPDSEDGDEDEVIRTQRQ